jgi:hypothetical protein
MTHPSNIRGIAIGVLSLATTLWVLDVWFGEPFHTRNTPEKIRHLEVTHEPYNTILLGTSVTYRHLDPSVLDTAFLNPSSSKPENFRPYTINLGISDLRITELESIVDLVLARRDLPIQRVIMEMGISPYPQRNNDRALMSHTFSNLPYHLGINVGRSLESLPLPYSLVFAAAQVGETVEQTTAWLTRRGLLIDFLHGRRKPIPRETIRPETISRRGFYPHDLSSLPNTDPTAFQTYRRFIADHPDFLAETLERYESISRGNLALLTEAAQSTDFPRQFELIAKLQSAGHQVIAFLPPRRDQAICHVFRHSAPADLMVVDLCDPTEYPELYQTHHRVDEEHLETKGVALLNLYFAQALMKPKLRARL